MSDAQKNYAKLMKSTNFLGKAMFSNQASQEIEVSIRPDKSISPGMFKPDPLNPGNYKAHPTTIRALKKDIFVAGSDEFADLEEEITCNSCSEKLDKQFWFFCPFCEAKFPS